MLTRLALLAAVAGAVAASTSGAAPAGVPGAPHVLLIGDSVATGMQWHNDAIAALQKGLNVDWQVAVCRRLTGPSCTFDGDTPPNLVDLVTSLGVVDPIVVVEMGYNDFESTFAASVDQSIRTLLQHGAQHVIWLTLREVHHPYIHMNDILVAAAKRYPQVKVVDWNMYARSHPDWFQTDGEHLIDAGGVAMAGLIHLAVDEVAFPLRITPGEFRTPRVGSPYSLQLAASGGQAPYRWSLVGSPPLGLHLLASGRIYGTPRRAQRVTFRVRCTDAEGQITSRRIVLSVQS
ncbi:MAG TPA: putative Ig domain-containing protein [Gaiellaceae bacterium]|nr:putative Ig domain-containing protein [Gaiellaceae bacterium]